MTEKILEVQELTTELYTKRGFIKAVDKVSFDVYKGKTLGIVGESGSGKSMTALSIMRLLEEEKSILKGEILFDGANVLGFSEEEMRVLRGNKLTMIFQEPMTCLNPVLTIGEQIAEGLMLHKGLSSAAAYKESIQLLDQVGIPDPDKRVKTYPHQLSGGQRQRVMIAIAVACEPELLIADEPTTALDVTTEAQVIDLILRLQKERDMGMIFITHDFGLVAQVCDEVAVMYAGKIVEYTSTKNLFAKPMHPYTQGLLRSIPTLQNIGKKEPLATIKGGVPAFADLPQGCSFQGRCDFATERCKLPVVLEEKAPGHYVACFHPRNVVSKK